ncbi:MAG: hypothetical protein LUF83_00385 [Alistipes sp.]|nr:hypothetical protein [Alistipes sp.]
MKLKLNISDKFLMAFVAVLFSLSTACEQDYELELPLAVMQKTQRLDAAGGQTHVLVYATDDWTASFDGDIRWAEISKASGSGNGEFVFTFELNPGIVRKADVVLTSGSHREVITMIQNGYVSEPQLTLMKKQLLLPDWKSGVSVAFDTNMDLALERIATEVVYGDEAETPGWISDVTVTEDAVLFTTAANESGEERTAQLVLSVNDNVNDRVYSSSITITQGTEAGYMRFPEDSFDVESFAKRIADTWSTNMEAFFDEVECEVVYAGGSSDWISDIVLESDAVSFDVAENTTSGIREATLRFTYSDDDGNSCSAEQKVVQARPALEMSFGELRAMQAAAGEIGLERDFIVGTVISEPGNANLETNPHTSWTAVDHSVNAKTAYIQSLDGKYGFRIQAAAEADVEALPRYATVKIALAGLKLVREDAPVQYTLADFTAANVLETTSGSASSLVRKERYIADLTDDDLYTFVSLKDVELAFNMGSYGNMHDGFALKSDVVTGGNATATRCDCVPRTLRDIQGKTLNMLVNAQTPWRRTGSRVPQGSGIVSGILVHSTLPRYGGDIGRYQLRPLSEADLVLHATESFSAKLVDWEWASKTMTAEAGSDRRIPANTGTGIMDTSSPLTGTKIGRTTAFTGLSFASFSGSFAGRYNGTWWNFTRNEGEWVSWTFSTSEITGNDRHLTLVFTAGLGNQTDKTMGAPLYWDLEYSTDGVNFTTFEEDVLIYPAPVFAYTGMNMPANLPEYVFELPDALLGQANVTVRLKAASTVCSSMSGLDSENVTASTGAVYFRFEEVTVKYNK